jgi:hypothetical protein
MQGGRKTVPGLSPGGTRAEGEENETRLVAAGPPGRSVAGLAAVPGLGGLRGGADCHAWRLRLCKPSGG